MRKIMRLMLLGGLLVFIGCGEPNVQKTTQESITEDNTIVETPTEVSTSTTKETTEIKVDIDNVEKAKLPDVSDFEMISYIKTGGIAGVHDEITLYSNGLVHIEESYGKAPYEYQFTDMNCDEIQSFIKTFNDNSEVFLSDEGIVENKDVMDGFGEEIVIRYKNGKSYNRYIYCGGSEQFDNLKNAMKSLDKR